MQIKNKIRIVITGLCLTTALCFCTPIHAEVNENSESYEYQIEATPTVNESIAEDNSENYLYSEEDNEKTAEVTSTPVPKKSASERFKEIGNHMFQNNKANAIIITGLLLALGIVLLKNNKITKERKH